MRHGIPRKWLPIHFDWGLRIRLHAMPSGLSEVKVGPLSLVTNSEGNWSVSFITGWTHCAYCNHEFVRYR